jgi:hypothetical protein
MKYLNVEYELVGVLSFKKCEYLEWSVEVSGDSVIHKHKLTLRWGYFQRLVYQKLTIIYAFMKVAVIKHNITRCVTISHGDIFTKNKFQARVLCQIAFHLYGSID